MLERKSIAAIKRTTIYNLLRMTYLKIVLFFAAVFWTVEGSAQSMADNAGSKNSFMVKIDSLEIDIYNNYESDIPPVNLNNLREPTLFILNDKELKISKFSELMVDKEKIESVTIIQDPVEIKRLGYERFNSIVKVRTEKESY